MKQKLIAFALACLPLMATAQNTWELPQQAKQEQQAPVRKAEKAKNHAAVLSEDARYLAGAVPEVNGQVVFTLDRDVPNLSDEEIYDRMFALLDTLTHEKNQLENSRIAVVNKAEHTIAATVKEWLVFSNSFLSLDQTELDYTLIARIADHHLHLTLERIIYRYEKGRGDARDGMDVKAEDWINDANALNKSKTRLLRGSAKFRRKTIDRKDNLFERVCRTLGVSYVS